jgi:chromosome segregation ATPase
MNSIIEKEKKLNEVLLELKNLDLSNPDLKNNIDNLSSQKTQLEIEKSELESKYESLLEEHKNLEKKLEETKNKEKLEEKKQIEFSDKIDELNQETDTLLEEIDKWQM